MDNLVSVFYDELLEYPKPPFNPREAFPELDVKAIDSENIVYGGVRELFRLLGFDSRNFGGKSWNPLGDIVSEGDTVVLKPNFVLDLPVHAITHGSVLRPVIDYTLKALSGSGKIIIADAPLQSGDFRRILEISGVGDLVDYFQKLGVSIEVVDLRREISIVNEDGIIVRRVKSSGDPKGYVEVDLGRDSYLDDISSFYEKYRVTEYNRDDMITHHNREKNEYLVSKTILDADTIINIPKLKTHKKAGVTLALKNMVGMNGDKSWLPHHRIGAPSDGGDEYPMRSFRKQFESRAIDYFRTKPQLWCEVKKLHDKVRGNGEKMPADCKITYDTREGSWWGNDTIWRTVLDLNTILLYSDKRGELKTDKQRKYLAVVDGILAGERDGPIKSTLKKAGLIVSGTNPVHVDFECARLMGFDPLKIKTIMGARNNGKYPLLSSDIEPKVKSNEKKIPIKNFIPAAGWVGHIERK
ncbi:MAG: DUF362 domain-containing protein [Methanobacteriota archaeon]